ncbi:ABC transporter ATP-binding protein [Dactylosporangium siamense]|uniref:ABC transporter ATP-binding protein n=1 Tax=Dactylosporangium siamense TaxID=685454 RepID=A0A919PNG9_9ACTN|nr:ABC transporter ATP-binding protein [Dactylosporangium siamense]GIG47204.1 ABC transporter ATP-binding protein [Dactylosporangium siamense]
MPADDVVVEVEGASKSFRLPSGEHLRLLNGVDLTVTAGDSVAIQGRSGSGKSTLLRALGLFIPFDEGRHHMLGVDIRAAGDRRCSKLRARSIGFVFQDFRLLPNLTAQQNVEYGCLLAGLGPREGARAAREALERVGLTDRARSRPAQLSGGEQQRVSIARALVKRPDLVLADEPTGSLDGETADVVIELLLASVADLGAALVLVTHDDAVAGRCGRRVRLGGGTLHDDEPAAAGGG